MKLGAIQNYGSFNSNKTQNQTSFGKLKIDVEEVDDFKDAFGLIFTTPKLKQAAADVFERIDKKSTQLSKDCVLEGVGTFDNDLGACIDIKTAESRVAEKLNDNLGQGSLSELYCEDVINNKPSEKEILEKLDEFETKTIEALENNVSVSDDFVDYKRVLDLD